MTTETELQPLQGFITGEAVGFFVSAFQSGVPVRLGLDGGLIEGMVHEIEEVMLRKGIRQVQCGCLGTRGEGEFDRVEAACLRRGGGMSGELPEGDTRNVTHDAVKTVRSRTDNVDGSAGDPGRTAR